MEKKDLEKTTKNNLPKTGTLKLSSEQQKKLEQTISMNTIQGTDAKDLAKALKELLNQK